MLIMIYLDASLCDLHFDYNFFVCIFWNGNVIKARASSTQYWCPIRFMRSLILPSCSIKFEPIIRSAVIKFWARCDISFPFGKKVGSECEDLGSNLRRCSMLLPLFHFHFYICKWSNYVQNEERRQMNLKISSLKLLLQNSFMAVSSQLGVRVSSCCASFQNFGWSKQYDWPRFTTLSILPTLDIWQNPAHNFLKVNFCQISSGNNGYIFVKVRNLTKIPPTLLRIASIWNGFDLIFPVLEFPT